MLAIRARRSFARARMASSTAGQYFSCSGVNCSAFFMTLMRAVLIVNSAVPGYEAAEPDATITRLAELMDHIDRWS